MSESLATTCVQGGYRPGDAEPRQVPIYQSTTWKYDTSEHMGRLFDLEESGYFYTRLQNPTNDFVAAKICELEGGSAAMLTSSGQAANFFAVFNIAGQGDHVVASSAIYGGTYNLLRHTMARMGLECTFVSPDCSDDELEAAFRPNTKAVFGETIANPALNVLDIERFANAAHVHGVPLIVDNTFPTPVNCRPLNGALISSPIPPRNTWMATALVLAAALLIPASLTGTLMLISSPVLLRPTKAIMAWCTPSASGWKVRLSPRPPRSLCAILALFSRRRMRFC